MNHHHPEPSDAECASVVATLRRELHSIIVDEEPPGAKGMPIDRDPAALLAMGEALCDSGDFHNALPIALHLVSRPGVQPRHAFLAATCLQRLRRPELAIGAFGFCTLLEGDAPTPGPLFRAAECCASLGQSEQAVQVLETAIEIARMDAQHAAIQSLAQAKLDAIRAVC